MQNRYRHTLTAQQLRAAAKRNPNANNLSVVKLYSDQLGEKNTADEWAGLEVLQKDCGRDVKINGNSKTVAPLSDGEAGSHAFRAMLHEELGVDPRKFNSSYSQNLQSILTHSLSYNTQIGIEKGWSYSFGFVSESSGREANVYRENGEIYCKIKIEKYVASQSFLDDTKGEGSRMVIPGPVEILYKLVDTPQGSMFELQYIATDSDFLRDVFLVKKEGLEEQLKLALLDVSSPKSILRSMADLLAVPPLEFLPKNAEGAKIKEAIQDYFFQALKAIGQFQQATMSANQLVEELEKLKHSVELMEAEATKKQPFLKRHSIIGTQNNNAASLALEQAIARAKNLPDYKSTPSFTSASNDAENKSTGSSVKIHLNRGSSSA